MEKIQALRENKVKATRLNGIIQELSKPDTQELSGIIKLYQTTRKHFGVEKNDQLSYLQRKAFVAVILCLYCPSALIGGYIKTQVKREIAQILNVSMRNVNYIAYDMMFYYDHYADFRNEVDKLAQRLRNEIISEDEENNIEKTRNE